MDRLKEAIKRLEEFGEDRYYTKGELKVLEQHFGRKIAFAFAGWVAFIKEDGHHDYCGSFGTKTEDLMIDLYEKRIQGLKELANRIDSCTNDDEVMGICAKIMLGYAKKWEDVDARMDDTIRAKRVLTSIKSIDVKRGRLAYEGKGDCYSAIVLDPYHGSMVVRRLESGDYMTSRRVPLCGESRDICDSMHIKKACEDFMRFIAY